MSMAVLDQHTVLLELKFELQLYRVDVASCMLGLFLVVNNNNASGWLENA